MARLSFTQIPPFRIRMTTCHFKFPTLGRVHAASSHPSSDGFHLHSEGLAALPPACGATVVYELCKLPVNTITPYIQVSLT
jgi:hypothetical protein